MEEIIVMEGEKLDLNVYLSRKYRELINVRYEFIHTSNATLGKSLSTENNIIVSIMNAC